SALETSLQYALQWLKRHQHAEGLWSARSFGQLCEGDGCGGGGADEHDVGTTALAVLAILEAGPLRERYEDSARNGLAGRTAGPGRLRRPQLGEIHVRPRDRDAGLRPRLRAAGGPGLPVPRGSG